MRNEMEANITNLSDIVEAVRLKYGYDHAGAYAHVAGAMFALASEQDRELLAKALGL
jgi:hypothetical protein